MAPHPEDVYCTLLMSDSYLPGAAVLAHSLRDAGTKKKLAALVTLDTLSADTVSQLKSLYDYILPVERIPCPNPANLYVMGRPDLSFALTKIALWRQTQFRKIVYLDADVVALRALDELFDIEANFAAAPDIGWPDAFNTGVMLLTPNMGEFWALQTLAATGDSFDGADQGLLNQYFEHRPWQRLKFTYNCTPNAEYQWEPAYRYYKRDIAAVHFIGRNKPWVGQRTGASGVYGELLARWWAVHDRHLRQETTPPASVPHPSQQSQRGQSARNEGDTLHPPSSIAPSAPHVKIHAPAAPVHVNGQTSADSGEASKSIDQAPVEPTPQPWQPFVAPQAQWDATRSEPPQQSRPEASNFPNQTYEFSESRTLFKAPQSYPEAPKNMWYKVPELQPKPAEKLNPIFPWEQDPNRPKATRVFAEDTPASPTPRPAPAPALPSPTHSFSTVHYQDEMEVTLDEGGAGSLRNQVASPTLGEQSWQNFQQGTVNAWDSIPGIENFVRAVMDSHSKRRRSQDVPITLPSLGERRRRRESLILTDFPTAVERPSLPVTPAAVRRPTFWGEERDESGELPAAEGVPDQTHWNPNAQLEQLRRSSLVEFEHLKQDHHADPPLRALPEHSIMPDFGSWASDPPTYTDTAASEQQRLGPTTDESSTSSSIKTGVAAEDLIGRVSLGASMDDQLKDQQIALSELIGKTPSTQSPAEALDTAKTLEASGIARRELAAELQGQAPPIGEDFYAQPGASSMGTTSSEPRHTPTSSTASSSSQKLESLSDLVQAGQTTFVGPNFQE